MNSMTGFGSYRYRGRNVELDVHVKSVNGRFLEVRLHVPKEFAPLEAEVRGVLKGWDRGTIDVYVQRLSRRERTKPKARVNAAAARYWVDQLRGVGRALKLRDDISIRDVLNLPQVLESTEVSVDAASEAKPLLAAVGRAVAICQTVRRREGARLKRELLIQLNALGAAVRRLERKEKALKRTAAGRLQSRLAALGSERLDPERLAIESALILDKHDVREELVRLKEHIRACQSVISGVGARGKKLDFYGQELLREVNTIGSKSSGAELTNVVIEAKSIIEKFREQVQNIE